MDAAANAAAPPDLENGAAGVGMMQPCPADWWLKEKQPFTWLGAAPYIAAVLVGAALVAAGVAVGVDAKQGQGDPDHFTVGRAIFASGVVVVAVGLIAAAMAVDEGCCDCNPRRFGPD